MTLAWPLDFARQGRDTGHLEKIMSFRHSTRFACFVSVGLFAAAPAFAQSCTAEVGAEEAQTYVDQCLEVSAATHPPCTATPKA